MKRLIQLVITTSAALAVTGAALAQSWNGSQGSSILRTSTMAIGNSFDRPGLFFLKRPSRMLPPSFAYIAPYGEVRVRAANGLIVKEFYPADMKGQDIYTASMQSKKAALRKAKSRKAG